MPLKRIFAFLVDYMLCFFLQIMIYIGFPYAYLFLTGNEINYHMFPKIEFNLLFKHYTFGVSSFLAIILLTLGMALMATHLNGDTIGDKIFNIHIVSERYKGFNFYFLRFLFRTVSFVFLHIFLIITIIVMIVKKNPSILWYDSILEIKCELKR